MRVIYIGQYSDGTTSKMRANQLQAILCADTFTIIDTHIPFHNTPKLWRSIGFRFKIGFLIRNSNAYILEQLKKNDPQVKFDLIWVDKGVYINQKVTKLLRASAIKLVHFTPDPTFTYHRSIHFFKSGHYYDFLVTTKSFELAMYNQKFGQAKIILVTQGFDKKLHKPIQSNQPKHGFLFIGHHEKEREIVLESLLALDITVVLAGINWDKFVKKHRDNNFLKYLGRGVYGDEYSNQLALSKMAWGALSKWIPEQHTTRTFEIPACGTALLTEYNSEIASFYKEDEVVYYNSIEELLEKVQYFFNHEKELALIAKKGYQRVHANGYDYETILRTVLSKI